MQRLKMFTDELNSIKTKSEITEEVQNSLDIWKQEVFDDVAKDCVKELKNSIKYKVTNEDFVAQNNKKLIVNTYEISSFRHTYLYDVITDTVWRSRLERIKKVNLQNSFNDEIDEIESNSDFRWCHEIVLRLKFFHSGYSDNVFPYADVFISKYGFLGLKRKVYAKFTNKNRVKNFFNKIKEEAAKDSITIKRCYFKLYSYDNQFKCHSAFVDLENNEIPDKKWFKSSNGIMYDLCIDYSISF